MSCKSTTRDQRFYFPSEGSHTQDFYALKKKKPSTPAGFEPANLGFSGEYDKGSISELIETYLKISLTEKP